MSDSDAKRKLVDFLDRKAFDPVLRADPGDYPESKRATLKNVQDATKKERERYHHYGSASQVVQMFKDDLNSEPAKKIHRELHTLGLPTINELRKEFEGLAQQLKIGA